MPEDKKNSAWEVLALELAAGAIRLVSGMTHQAGAEVVETRDSSPGAYRYRDPETLRIDRELEDYFMETLAEKGIDALVLSEEAGLVKVYPRCAPEVEFDRPVYFVSDPFDGTLLYKRNIQAFWYSAFAFYTRPVKPELAEPLAAVVADCNRGEVFFCNPRQSFLGNYTAKGSVEKAEPLQPNETVNLAEAFLETYLMKPDYMYPAAEQFKFLFRGVKFILPNGGPSGFCNVASGRVDVYLALKQPHTDVFTGIAIAQRAGCPVTTLEGNPVRFEEDVRERYSIICSANATLHQRVLDLLKKHGITDQA